MNIITSLFLGFIQGVTEFLPVSSSGHLVLVQKLIPGFSQPGILFDTILHFGTLSAVLYFFRKQIFKMSFNYMLFLAIGTVPAVVAAILFRKQFVGMFSDTRFLGTQFLITGVICFLIDSKSLRRSVLNIKNSLIIGIAQAVAIIPAISRSGITILAGTKSGLDKKEAATYSFLLSVPAILGANLLEIISHYKTGFDVSFTNYIAGFVAAFIMGFLSIGVLLKLLVNSKFKIFGYYCIALGIAVMLIFRTG